MKKRVVLSSRRVYEGKHISVREDEVQEDGNLHHYEIVEHPGAVAILALDEEGSFILERQYRRTAQDYLYEIPAGTLQEGEEEEKCARRELLEETGYIADEMIKLLSIRTSPGYTDEVLHIFFCKVSKRLGQKLEQDEDIEVLRLEAKKLKELIKLGRVVDAKTLASLFIAEKLGLVEV